jgi:hypothetical protein
LTVLEFPLPSEKGVRGPHPPWPQIVFDIWNAPPTRNPGDTGWDHRVRQLLAIAQKGNIDREQATSQLAYLAVSGALKPDETTAFGSALWSDLDAQEGGLPANPRVRKALCRASKSS